MCEKTPHVRLYRSRAWNQSALAHAASDLLLAQRACKQRTLMLDQPRVHARRPELDCNCLSHPAGSTDADRPVPLSLGARKVVLLVLEQMVLDRKALQPVLAADLQAACAAQHSDTGSFSVRYNELHSISQACLACAARRCMLDCNAREDKKALQPVRAADLQAAWKAQHSPAGLADVQMDGCVRPAQPCMAFLHECLLVRLCAGIGGLGLASCKVAGVGSAGHWLRWTCCSGQYRARRAHMMV